MVKTWQIILATVAIFVAGLVTGGATAFGVVRWVARHGRMNPAQMPSPWWVRPNKGPQQFGPQLMRSFENRLDLTKEQRDQIGPIVKRTVQELGRQRHEVQLTSALAIERMQDEIAAVLTPEQRVKFEDLISQQRARLQQFRQQQQPAPKNPPAAPPGPTPDPGPK
jgi:Spy/CpxP family protein refolding chaperone